MELDQHFKQWQDSLHQRKLERSRARNTNFSWLLMGIFVGMWIVYALWMH